MLSRKSVVVVIALLLVTNSIEPNISFNVRPYYAGCGAQKRIEVPDNVTGRGLVDAISAEYGGDKVVLLEVQSELDGEEARYQFMFSEESENKPLRDDENGLAIIQVIQENCKFRALFAENPYVDMNELRLARYRLDRFRDLLGDGDLQEEDQSFLDNIGYLIANNTPRAIDMLNDKIESLGGDLKELPLYERAILANNRFYTV